MAIVNNIEDGGINMLEPGKRVAAWNAAAYAIKGAETAAVIRNYVLLCYHSSDTELAMQGMAQPE
jgi:hypothetical protein